MIGTIIGDISGSRFEFRNHKDKEGFSLLVPECEYTDDSVMTIAIAKALMECAPDVEAVPAAAIRAMQELGRKYPNAGYGGNFFYWLFAENPEPYGSYGNGAAMRVSACAYASDDLETVKKLSRAVTAVSHDHPEAIKGAEAVCTAIFLARKGATKEEIRKKIEEDYYTIDFTLDEIRKDYRFDVSCQGSVPQALEAFFESVDYEDALRNAISIGGDSDTIAAICGSVAEAFYEVPKKYYGAARFYLTKELYRIMKSFEENPPVF